MIIICDILFSTLILIGVCWQHFICQEMTTGQFYLALLGCYVGARYLLFSSLEFHIISSLNVVKVEEEEEDI